MSEPSDHYVGKLTRKAILFGPDDQVLLTKCDDHWEPPGGTFEYGETLVGGLRRELREELAIDSRAGPLVEAMYGGWIDETTGEPMVTLVYRCETDERAISLNDEHDAYEWLTPEAAATRLSESFVRLDRAVERADAFDGSPPFAAVTNPYADTHTSSETVLEQFAVLRESASTTQ
ncbi:NUDIX domain-containing protein [Halocatena pleomorpha]|uniref:NUDIX domain-containing protein n=1 Tax=Halocatena pleomorpha TaxID=1785090 RepID=A0A3P3RBB0_9EURY|nr:NUDIX domain-containing protein [Halocatena pleomorpha]RRJ29970.1 NUDIX domain-containing protein [Halocatena pleomorpha]